MPDRDKDRGLTVPEGLAGGPGPTPPGFDDGLPKPLEGAPAAAAGARPPERADPEEPDPS